MNEQKILNKAITIQEIQMKSVKGGSKYSLRDHEGKTFNFFTTRKDGTDTAVYRQFKTVGLQVGDTILIGYVEDEFEIDGKLIVSKKIINFRETNEEPSQTAHPAQSPRGESSGTSQGNSNDTYGRRLAIHGFVNGMLAAGATIENVLSLRQSPGQ